MNAGPETDAMRTHKRTHIRPHCEGNAMSESESDARGTRDDSVPVLHSVTAPSSTVDVAAAYRAELDRELLAMFGPSWRSPLPANPTPAQELAALRRDAARLHRAEQVVRYRRVIAAHERRAA